MEGALKWRGGKSGQRYFQQREGRAGVVVVSLTRRAKRVPNLFPGSFFFCFVLKIVIYKVWVVTPNLPTHLIAKKLIAFILEAHRVYFGSSSRLDS